MKLQYKFLMIGLFLMTTFVIKAQNKTNFVLIIGDDISYNDLGCYGNKIVKTPRIDQIASEGLRFNNAFVAISSCSPCRHTILTSRYPHNNGSLGLEMDPPDDMPIFSEILKNSGYYCAHAGKWHQAQNTARGYDLIHRSNNGSGGENNWVNVIETRPKDKPFFFWFAAHDAHRVWQTDNEFIGTHTTEGIVPPPYLGSSEATKQDIASYYDEIARLDFHIGEVEKALEKQGVLENTMIIIITDNGRPFPHCKTRVNEEGVHVPLIVRWPGGNVIANKTTDAMVSAIDIAPTILTVANIDIPQTMQGESFLKVLQKPELEFRNYIFAEHNFHDFEALERMVRNKEFLYVYNARPNLAQQGAVDIMKGAAFKELQALRDSNNLSAAQADIFMIPRPVEELYKLEGDTMQLLNLASLPEYKADLVKMRALMQRWMTETHDDIPIQIRGDRFSRETALPFSKSEWIEGIKPGVTSGSLKTNNKGPF